MPIRRHLAVSLVFAVSTAMACGPAEAPPEAPAAESVPSGPTLQGVRALGVRNAAMPVEGLITAGQLSPDQFDAMVEMGYGAFISLRLPGEDGAGWEEGRTAEGSFGFSRLPVSGAAGLNRETVAELARLLESAEGRPTVLYCGSSNRVGALLALKAHWIDGASAEEAYALGQAAGMTRLEPAVRDLLGM
jgi:protein tyrosine phosphatase (PTP) superfamily phosphohydrolase (DUF442 family)